MTRAKAETLLTIDIATLSLEQLQKHRVKLLDAWRESEAEYGYKEAVENGFYAVITSESASGFTPVNPFLTTNLKYKFNETENLLQSMYKTR